MATLTVSGNNASYTLSLSGMSTSTRYHVFIADLSSSGAVTGYKCVRSSLGSSSTWTYDGSSSSPYSNYGRSVYVYTSTAATSHSVGTIYTYDEMRSGCTFMDSNTIPAAGGGTKYYCRIHAFASGGSFSGGSDNYYTATITSSTVSFEYDVTNLQTPTRAGYTFLGWGYSESAENYYTDKITISTTSQSSTSPGIYNLYAIWTKTKYNAYIRMGAGISSMSVYVDGSLKSYITDSVYHRLEVNLESSITIKAIGKKAGYEKPYTVNFYISDTSTTPNTSFESNSDEVEYLYYSHHKYAEITAKKASIDLFYWENTTWDAANIKAGQPISNLTATRWNNLMAKIQELAEAEGGSYSYSGVSSGGTIYATTFNAARAAISNRSGYGTLPAAQSKGNSVKAALFEGSGSLKSALNAAISYHNNS